ncbi:MAG: calcium/sodium antiporter [Dehalococcoidia bacterium]|nr:calcium/sodium antiporter [Dehalococcoidia bacterium]
MDILTVVLFFAGLVLLVLGAEGLVRGASRVAATVGISPLVIGLTVVAFGTSAPEMAVSVQSALSGNADVAIGNVVGSNIFNVLFILGLSAAIVPLAVSRQLIRLDVPLMVGVSVLLLVVALDGSIGRLDGAILFSGIVLYTGWAIVSSRRANRVLVEEYGQEYGGGESSALGLLRDAALILGGLVLLVLGSDWFVAGATEFAELLGVSDLVIGLTLVAAGTSMPELATSVVASIRGERDIAVGNVVGSNIFNILAVLGLSALVAGDGVAVADSALRVDMPIMLAVAVICFPSFYTGRAIARWEGITFIALYIAYVFYLYINATNPEALGGRADAALGGLFAVAAVAWMALALRDRARGTPSALGAGG